MRPTASLITMPHTSPRIALTPGEPAGIGPDLCLMLATSGPPAVRAIDPVLIADPTLLRKRARQLGLEVDVIEYEGHNDTDDPTSLAHPRVRVLPVPLDVPVQAGRLDPGNAGYVLRTLERAVDGCLDGSFDALVTGPVHKAVINEAGIAFTGHTEFLAERTATEQVVMMLAAPGLRVALVTTHLPLSEVSRAITPERLERVIRVLDHDLRRRFGFTSPRLLICGLNPHAGEGGHLGREEIEIITPVLERLRRAPALAGTVLDGPLPADTLFTPKYLDHADAVLAMYHDQGLPVLKHMGFGQAVNITLGLPLIRTSVDHGTALDLAGSGRANPGSLYAALDTAVAIALRAHI